MTSPDELQRAVRESVQQALRERGLLGSSPVPSAPSTPPTPPAASPSTAAPARGDWRPKHPRRVMVTQEEIMAVPTGGSHDIAPDAIVTPLARQTAEQRHVTLREMDPGNAPHSHAEPATKRGAIIALGADHGGFALKEQLKHWLEAEGHTVRDCGAYDANAVDYPDVAAAVAKQVSSHQATCGIMIDAVGVGSCMAANKVRGVRAAMGNDVATARNSREHNNANVLTLGGKVLTPDQAREIVRVWLATPFGGGRHTPRIEKIMRLEQR